MQDGHRIRVVDALFGLFFFLLFFVIGTAMYFIPTVVGMLRRVPNRGSLVVVNLFLGWTLIGWVVALAMALRDPVPDQQVVVVQPPPQPAPKPPIYDTPELEAAAEELPDDPFEELN